MFEIGRHPLETSYGTFLLIGHLFGDNQQTVLSVVRYPDADDDRPWMLRVQYGCINATAFHAIDCDCGQQIDNSFRQIQAHGKGVLVYFRDHEAFGLGLAEKLRIVAEEKRSGRSFQAVLDSEQIKTPRTDIMWVVPRILADLGIKSGDNFILLSQNSQKRDALSRVGVNLAREVPV